MTELPDLTILTPTCRLVKKGIYLGEASRAARMQRCGVRKSFRRMIKTAITA